MISVSILANIFFKVWIISLVMISIQNNVVPLREYFKGTQMMKNIRYCSCNIHGLLLREIDIFLIRYLSFFLYRQELRSWRYRTFTGFGVCSCSVVICTQAWIFMIFQQKSLNFSPRIQKLWENTRQKKAHLPLFAFLSHSRISQKRAVFYS